MGKMLAPTAEAIETQGAVQDRSFFFSVDEKPSWGPCANSRVETNRARKVWNRHEKLLAANSGRLMLAACSENGELSPVTDPMTQDTVSLHLEAKDYREKHEYTWTITIGNPALWTIHTLRTTPDFFQTTYRQVDSGGQILKASSHVSSLALANSIGILLSYADSEQQVQAARVSTSTNGPQLEIVK